MSEAKQTKIKSSDYPETFGMITAICNEREILQSWMSDRLRPVIDNEKTFSFLSVGAGPGNFDFALMRNLRACGQSEIKYTAVEPSPAFSQILEKRAHLERHIQGQILPHGFEDAQLHGKFDFILFMHSLYYMKNRRAVIERALEHLTVESGKLILVHQASQGVSLIQNFFVSRLKLRRNPGMSAEILLDVIDGIRSKVPLRSEYSVVPTTIETTEVFDRSSRVGPLLFRFLLNIDPETAQDGVLNEFRDFVRNISYRHADRYYMHQPLGVFVLGREADRGG